MIFPVVLHKDADSEYGVTVPDAPGCFSAGATGSLALENAQEAQTLHIEGRVAEDEALPQAQDVDVHMANPDYAAGVWAVIDFDVMPYQGKPVRFKTSLPENLLQRIDEQVQRDHCYASRSGFLATAALRELSAE